MLLNLSRKITFSNLDRAWTIDIRFPFCSIFKLFLFLSVFAKSPKLSTLQLLWSRGHDVDTRHQVGWDTLFQKGCHCAHFHLTDASTNTNTEIQKKKYKYRNTKTEYKYKQSTPVWERHSFQKRTKPCSHNTNHLLDHMLDTLTDHLIKPTQIILGLTPSCYTMDISILQYRHQLPRW